MRNVICLSLLFLLLSCESKVKYEKPENLIAKEQMIDLLYDIHLANGTSGVKNKDLENNMNYMSLVFEKYKIDSGRFAESNLYYTSNINEYEDIFEEVERRLEALKTEFDRKRDSVFKQLKETKKLHAPNILTGKDSIKKIN